MSPQGNGSPTSNVTIRRAESIADYRACQEVQRRCWGITEESYVIPVATLVGANLHGGLVLGAFLADGRAVAMSFGFLGRLGNRICLYSQLTGVVPEYQAHGLGYAVKLVQRHHALAEGLSLIAWAFDPLQSGNGHFNIHRLGARSHRYIENMYGERTDELNAGVPTDRLIVDWETDPERETAKKLPATVDLPRACPRLIETGHAGPRASATAPEAPCLLLEVPERISELRKSAPALAGAWRQAVRDAFQTAFAAGYEVVEFIREGSPPDRRCYYVLRRSTTRDEPSPV